MVDTDSLNENKEIIEKLNSIPVLKNFNDKDIQGMLKLSKVIRYERGETIIKEGQYDNWIYFIIQGKVGIKKQDETIGVLKQKGDIFGEMGIIDGSPRSATIMAIDETFCLALDASYSDRLQNEEKFNFNCILYQIFAQILAVRLRLADEALVRAKDEVEMLKAELRARA